MQVPTHFAGPSPTDGFSLLGNGAAAGISADGSVIVGEHRDPGGGPGSGTPAKWTQADGWLPVGDPLGSATGASADGSVIAGFDHNGTGDVQAFRWTQAFGRLGLGNLGAGPGGSSLSVARGISANGNVIVGHSSVPDSQGDAFRWTLADGMVGLGYLPGDSDYSDAYATSADGSVIVGQSRPSGSSGSAVRWTQATGWVALGPLPGELVAAANSVSADGNVIVGNSYNGNVYQAFLWDPVHGSRNLKSALLNEYGLDIGKWQLTEAIAISPDGRSIVGSGTDPSGNANAGYLIDLDSAPVPEPSTLSLVAVAWAILLTRRLAGSRRGLSGLLA